MNLVNALVEAFERRIEETVTAFHSVGRVTAVSPPRAEVDIAGGSVNLGYPTHYTPAVGDIVQVIGRPGARFIVAKLV